MTAPGNPPAAGEAPDETRLSSLSEALLRISASLDLETVLREVIDGARALIGDLLDAGRIDTGTLSVAREPSEVGELVEQARTAFISGDGRHTVLVDLPADHPRAMADRVRIVQVLNNLLANAARHSPHSLPIRVAAERDGIHVAVSVTAWPGGTRCSGTSARRGADRATPQGHSARCPARLIPRRFASESRFGRGWFKCARRSTNSATAEPASSVPMIIASAAATPMAMLCARERRTAPFGGTSLPPCTTRMNVAVHSPDLEGPVVQLAGDDCRQADLRKRSVLVQPMV